MGHHTARWGPVGACALRNYAVLFVWLCVAGCTGPIEAEQPRGLQRTDVAPQFGAIDRELTVSSVSWDKSSAAQSEAEADMDMAVASRSGIVLPFGEADLYLGARNERDALLVWPGLRDAPGALVTDFGGGHVESDAMGRVLDLCVREEAYAAIRGGVLEPGEPMDSEALIWIRNSQLGLGCHSDSAGDNLSGRWFYMTRGGASPFFGTREEAQKWSQDQRDRYRNKPPPWAFPMGFINNSDFGIRYSALDTPIDEVRLLANTMTVRDGVLRGLVRNWSRSLWAYGVIVSTENGLWQWPLSVQPGEVAPFEIDGWKDSDDPLRFEITVDAQMSPKADVSRSYRWYNWNPRPSLSIIEAEQLEIDEGHETGIARLIADGPEGVRWTGSTAEFSVPTSHPSFADHVRGDSQIFAADNLVAYVAYLRWQREDQSNRVFEVIEQPVFSSPDDMDVAVAWFTSNNVQELAWIGIDHNPHAE